MEPQPIFNFLQNYGHVELKEMYQTFNMGMGFTIIVSDKDVDEAVKILQKHSGSEVKIIGVIQKGFGISIPKLELIF